VCRVVNGHLSVARLFKYCLRTSADKTACGASCRIFAALAAVIDSFCDQNIENQETLLPFVSPLILEYSDRSGGKRACNCDDNSFLQVGDG
jgi:hypothetical protein